MILKLHLVKKFILINHVNYLFNMHRLYILKLKDYVICLNRLNHISLFRHLINLFHAKSKITQSYCGCYSNENMHIMLGLSGETLQGMSLDSRSLCNYGKSLCGNGKPSGKFEPQKFNPKPRVKK